MGENVGSLLMTFKNSHPFLPHDAPARHILEVRQPLPHLHQHPSHHTSCPTTSAPPISLPHLNASACDVLQVRQPLPQLHQHPSHTAHAPTLHAFSIGHSPDPALFMSLQKKQPASIRLFWSIPPLQASEFEARGALQLLDFTDARIGGAHLMHSAAPPNAARRLRHSPVELSCPPPRHAPCPRPRSLRPVGRCNC